MSDYKLVIFDLDGTLLDTSEGIISAVRHTIDYYNLKELDNDALANFIGPPIQDSFKKYYDSINIDEVTAFFRDYYKTNELFKALPYPGIYDVMRQLLFENISIAVATYKLQDYAVKLLKHFNFDKYVSIICGADKENKLKKQDIINLAVSSSEISDYNNVVMVGDSDNDALGALNAGIDFIGVTYGFGFNSKEEIDKFPNIGYADDVEKVIEVILKHNYKFKKG